MMAVRRFVIVLLVCTALWAAVPIPDSPVAAQMGEVVVGPGFSYGILAVDAAVQEEVELVVPFPTGARSVEPLCAISSYLPDGVDQTSWRCTYLINATRGVVTFTLQVVYADRGMVSAQALVFDQAVFEIVDRNFNRYIPQGDQMRTTHPVGLTIAPDTLQFVAVESYDSGTDEDASFLVASSLNNPPDLTEGELRYDVVLQIPGQRTYVEANLLSLRPAPAVRHWHDSVWVGDGGHESVSVMVEPGMHTIAFASLTGYFTGSAIQIDGDDDFELWAQVGWSANDRIEFDLWGGNGDSDTQGRYDLYVLQIPADFAPGQSTAPVITPTFTPPAPPVLVPAGPTDTPTPPPPAATTSSSGPQTFQPPTASESGWLIKDMRALNPAPANGLGRLTVHDSGAAGYWIYPAGAQTQVGASYGDWAFDLAPGDYELWGGWNNLLGQATVQSGVETIIEIDAGRLEVFDPGAAGYWVFIAGTQTQVGASYGDWAFGLQSGVYDIVDGFGDLRAQAVVGRGQTTAATLNTGRLEVFDPGAAGYWVFIAGMQTQVGASYGDWAFGLYAGDYEIRDVNSAVIGRVTIRRGETTTVQLN